MSSENTALISISSRTLKENIY